MENKGTKQMEHLLLLLFLRLAANCGVNQAMPTLFDQYLSSCALCERKMHFLILCYFANCLKVQWGEKRKEI